MPRGAPGKKKRSTAAITARETPIKRGVGRPTLLTEEFRQRLLDLVKVGVVPRIAAVSAGVARKTWELWRRRAENGDEPYQTLMEDVDEAVATACVAMIAQVRRRPRDMVGIRPILQTLDPVFVPESKVQHGEDKDSPFRFYLPKEIEP